MMKAWRFFEALAAGRRVVLQDAAGLVWCAENIRANYMWADQGIRLGHSDPAPHYLMTSWSIPTGIVDSVINGRVRLSVEKWSVPVCLVECAPCPPIHEMRSRVRSAGLRLYRLVYFNPAAGVDQMCDEACVLSKTLNLDVNVPPFEGEGAGTLILDPHSFSWTIEVGKLRAYVAPDDRLVMQEGDEIPTEVENPVDLDERILDAIKLARVKLK